MIANINFYLKPGKSNKKGEKSIIMRVTYRNRRTVIHIGERVKVKYWSASKQVVKPNLSHEPNNYYDKINDRIDLYRNKMKDVLNDSIRKEVPLSDAFIKNRLKHYFETNGIDKTFFEAFEEYIETSKSIRAERTITGYTTVKNFLKKFEESTGYQIDYSTINLEFFDKLKEYAFKENQLLDNYFAKIINVLKAFLNWSIERDYFNSTIHHRFKATEKDNEVIFLTMDELFRLMNFDFKLEKHRKARDIFCFGCFTGFRISDIFQLQKDHVKNGMIVKSIQKTRETERIPLNKFAIEIINRYPEDTVTLLPRISSQKLNKYIKECCEKAEIDEPTRITKYSGNKLVESNEPKYKFITSHIARKTFITNSLILDMNPKAIKEIVGHKKDSTFNKYLKITEEYKKTQMQNTWDKLTLKDKENE